VCPRVTCLVRHVVLLLLPLAESAISKVSQQGELAVGLAQQVSWRCSCRERPWQCSLCDLGAPLQQFVQQVTNCSTVLAAGLSLFNSTSLRRFSLQSGRRGVQQVLKGVLLGCPGAAGARPRRCGRPRRRAWGSWWA